MTTSLDSCTDLPAMQALLQRRLPGFANGRWRIQALTVQKARRSSSLQRNPHPITLCYALQVAGGPHGDTGCQLLYAKMFRGGASADCFASIDVARLQPPAYGAALVHLAELDMVLWALPNDPGLPQLAALLNPERLRPLLPWAALGLDPQRCRSVEVSMLRYEPEQRATLRCAVTIDGMAAPLLLFGKTFCDARGRAIDERFQHFWQRAQIDPGAPLVAPPLGYDEATRTTWQGAAAGTPLLQVLPTANAPAVLNGADAPALLAACDAPAVLADCDAPAVLADCDAPAVLARVVQALATLHAAPLAWTRERPLAHWRAELQRRQTKIARAEPALAARAAALVVTLDALAERWAAVPLGLIHGDFHPGQVWLHNGRVVLFDFDEFTLGDTLEDIAEFALKLGSEPLAQAFIDAASRHAAGAFDHQRLRWHLAVQCLLQASRAFIFQRPGWRAELAAWFDRAERETAALSAELGTACSAARTAEFAAAATAATTA